MNRRVLVVDDAAMVREAMAALLKQYGYEVDTAADGADALRMIERRPYDVVFVDGCLPDMNGPQLVRAIRRAGGEGRPLRLIGETCPPLGITAAAYLEAGTDDCIEKLSSPEDYVDILRRWAPRE